ncbi:hypothetical protein TRIUR3_24366 [Triticum urartu]|uniref:Uncharacterized protein n=1 Tax=Triticum urartu TaxID=4572 RepID=M8AHX7_TRIUA|nr:hypothetical protein TRIUR3_24366 [Triticum urartu]
MSSPHPVSWHRRRLISPLHDKPSFGICRTTPPTRVLTAEVVGSGWHRVVLQGELEGGKQESEWVVGVGNLPGGWRSADGGDSLAGKRDTRGSVGEGKLQGRVVAGDDNIDMNIEDMMVMEAIWRSIQEQGSIGNPSCGSFMPFEQPTRERQAFVAAPPLEMPHPGGFSCAVAAMAEHQPSSMDFSYMTGSSAFPVFDMFRRPCNIAGGSMGAAESSPDSWSGIAPSCSRREVVREEGECSTDHWSEGAEAGTSYAGSDIVVDAGTMLPLPFADNYSMVASHFRPESIEEQMMYSMAVSLAEAHGCPPSHWHYSYEGCRYYSRKVHARSLEKGDLIPRRIQSAKGLNKLIPKWKGPYRVVQVTRSSPVRLETEDDTPVQNS